MRTGRTRLRVQPRWFRPPLLVLQVEVERRYGNPRSLKTWTRLEWRDAELDDYVILDKPGQPEIGTGAPLQPPDRGYPR